LTPAANGATIGSFQWPHVSLPSDRPASRARELLREGWLSTRELALSIGHPFRSVQRWVPEWYAAGVPGVVVARGPGGKGGLVYLVDPNFPSRYLAGLVGSPLARCG